MIETVIYKVYNKTFNNKQEANKYKQELLSDIDNIAWNLRLFYSKMLGYPGETTALSLINAFTKNNIFKFGQYKDNNIGKIICIDPQYITWLIKNTPFRLTSEEEALYKARLKPMCLGGYITDFSTDETYTHEGDTPDYNLINWLKEFFEKGE